MLCREVELCYLLVELMWFICRNLNSDNDWGNYNDLKNKYLIYDHVVPLASTYVDAQWHFQRWFDGLLQLHQQGLLAIPTRSASALLIPIRQVLTTGMFFVTLCWWWEVENINASYWWAKIRPINCPGLVQTTLLLIHLEGRRARLRPRKVTSSDSLFEQLRLEWAAQSNFRVANRSMSFTCRSIMFELMHSRVSDAIYKAWSL